MKYISTIVILCGFVITLSWAAQAEHSQAFPSLVFVFVGAGIMFFGGFLEANCPQLSFSYWRKHRKSGRRNWK